MLNKKDTKLFESISKCKVKCECEHTIVMPKADRTICSYCGNWIYRTPQIEFRYKMMKNLKERNKNEGI